GFDEMDEVSGGGSAELLDDGSIEIGFAYHNGDEAVLNAKRETSSTACSHVRIQGFGHDYSCPLGRKALARGCARPETGSEDAG
ncbi:MAG: hypothetical protein WCF37_02220, partial [Pseudolabrys sp.]